MKKLKDPEIFEGVAKFCVPVNSDDVDLQNCPFTHEYDNSPISSPSLTSSPASQPTGIIMLSLPSTESVTQGSLHEEFETPPEHNNSSQTYFSGSDDPKASGDADVQHDGDTDNAVYHGKNTMAVDLATDFDDLDFSHRGDSEEQIRKKVRVSEVDLDVKSSGLIVAEKERVVIEIDQTQEVDTELVVECEENVEVDEPKIEKVDLDVKSSGLKVEEKERVVIEIDQTQEVDTELVVACEENVEVDEPKIERTLDNSTVKMSERSSKEGEVREHVDNDMLNSVVGDDGGRGEESMNLDENEKLKGLVDDDGGRGVEGMNFDENEKSNSVGLQEMHSNGITESVTGGGGASGSVKVKRQLPTSMRGGDTNVELMEEAGQKAIKIGNFKDLMEAVSTIIGGVNDDDNDGDFFATAIRRGVTFPRPRWWPPEGFDD